MEIKYKLLYTKKAVRDIQLLKAAKLDLKAKNLCELLEQNPVSVRSKQLMGDLKGKRLVRINIQHRLVYEIFEKEKVVKILSLWSHYGD